jgi:TRAP-type C4-dicarboxylate transport system permease small subunit
LIKRSLLTGGIELIKILAWFDNHIEESVLTLMMFSFVVLVNLQVLTRYVVHFSLPWVEELTRYTFIWMAFIGTAMSTKNNTNIAVDLIDGLLPPKGRKILSFFAEICFLVFALLMTKAGFDVLVKLARFQQRSAVMSLNMAFVYGAFPVGMALTVFRLFQHICSELKRK